MTLLCPTCGERPVDCAVIVDTDEPVRERERYECDHGHVWYLDVARTPTKEKASDE